MSRYSIHPAEQQFRDWDMANKQKRNAYWSRLQKAFRDYQNTDPDGNMNSFRYHMESRYGLRVNMVGADIDSSYQIIDESKHTLFLLKYV
jgi:hypothetical protein